LVTDESMIGGEKFAAKSEFGFLLILTKQTSYALAKNRIPAPCAFGDSGLSKTITCHLGIAMALSRHRLNPPR